MNNKISVYILINFIYAFDFYPINNSELNYTQVFFRWPQIENAEYYKISINNDFENQIIESSNNSILIDDLFNWGREYYWNVCGLDPMDEVIYCYESYNFSIKSLPSYYPNGIELLVLENSYYDGITILDFDSIGFSAAVNQLGEPIWFIEKNNFSSGNNAKILVTELLLSGNFIGIGQGKGYEFDINGELIFETPDSYGVHHHFIKSDSTYFLIDASTEYHPCPENCPDNLPENIYWKGDQFIEIDENGELIWIWDTFDYIDLLDYNPYYLDRLSNSWPIGENAMDWTHSNSIFYHENNIFVSIRNLSRIAKIDYSTKDLVWHLGDENFMTQIYFNNNIEFSGQHSVQIVNNNILFFDNHSHLEPEISKCIEFSYDESVDSVQVVWEYTLPDSLFTGSRGECDRLINNNTLINVGRTGNLIEVDNNNNIVWHLKISDNNLDVASFRTSRVDNLYPLFFSFELNQLNGNYNTQNYTIKYLDNISGNIYNKGWSNQDYLYSLLDQYGLSLYSGTINIESNNYGQFIIPLSDFEINSELEYTLKIEPLNNVNVYQELDLSLIKIGDINNDNIINILDAIELVNLILNLEYNDIADTNDDDVLNVLDIILIINIILDLN